jgi:putative nucleotidyltransferase with HDIG domain
MHERLLASANRLPPQPFTAAAILNSALGAGLSDTTLLKLVELDPAFSVGVLRRANAAYFGSKRALASVRYAAVLIGTANVQAAAVNACSGMAFGEAPVAGPEHFWRHSVTTAVAAGNLARRRGVAHDVAYTAGLLHDVGSAVVHRVGLEPAGPMPGVDPVHLSADLLSGWGLPAESVRAIRLHASEPRLIGDGLSRILAAAHALSLALSPVEGHAGNADPVSALALVGLDRDLVDLVLGQIQREVDDLALFAAMEAA